MCDEQKERRNRIIFTKTKRILKIMKHKNRKENLTENKIWRWRKSDEEKSLTIASLMKNKSNEEESLTKNKSNEEESLTKKRAWQRRKPDVYIVMESIEWMLNTLRTRRKIILLIEKLMVVIWFIKCEEQLNQILLTQK